MASTPQIGKVRIFNQVTGEFIDRWPVDAREIIKVGDGQWATTPKPAEDVEPTVLAPATTVVVEPSPHLSNVKEIPLNPVVAQSGVSLEDAKKAGEVAPGVPLVIGQPGTAGPVHALSPTTRTTKGSK